MKHTFDASMGFFYPPTFSSDRLYDKARQAQKEMLDIYTQREREREKKERKACMSVSTDVYVRQRKRETVITKQASKKESMWRGNG